MDKLNEIRERLSEISITISRVPANTKREFIDLANAEFSGDYGMTLKWIKEQAFEYQVAKRFFIEKIEDMETKINLIFEKMNIPKEEKEKPKRLGSRIEPEGGNE